MEALNVSGFTTKYYAIMLHRLIIILALVAFSGCLIIPPPRGARSTRGGAKSCPPGKMWSDGQCHAKGKGHDPNKHADKKQKKKKKKKKKHDHRFNSVQFR